MNLNTSFKNLASHYLFGQVGNINAVILTMEQDEGFQGIHLPCVTKLSFVAVFRNLKAVQLIHIYVTQQIASGPRQKARREWVGGLDNTIPGESWECTEELSQFKL